VPRTVARKSSTGGLDVVEIDKTPLIYSVSYFNLGGLVLFGRAKPWRRDWLGDLVPIFVPPGKISLRRPGYGCCMAQQNCIRVFA